MRKTVDDKIYLGLMSGTSLDAIDAVAVTFEPGFRLLATNTLPLNEGLRTQILSLTLPGNNEIDQLGELDKQLGELFAECANQLITDGNIDRSRIMAIGSHGQTIRHRPSARRPFTLQIGDPNVIAENTGITVVADFRRRDMAVGGQGAPLVPAFHQAMFRSPQRDRVILNLGGIANITTLPADAHSLVRGYDTGPANILMDAWIQHCRQHDYDRNGAWAASGKLRPDLLGRMLQHPFFDLPAPKSTGREDFNLAWLQQILAADSYPDADIQATLCELTATSVAKAIESEKLVSPELILCGGGAYNAHLAARLQELLPKCLITDTSHYGLSPTWVEATAFAWLAKQTMGHLPGNLPAVTGAREARVLGGIYPGRMGR